jgi:DNA-binding MurR/RpiR family transcriptional regulator
MSAKQRIIAQYIMDHEEQVSRFSITQLAQKVGVNAASVSRFCQFLGFKGYADFRFSISHHLVAPRPDQLEPYREGDSAFEILEKMQSNCLQIWRDVFQLIDPRVIERAAKLIYDAREVYIFAAGGTTGTAYFAQKMFLHIGIQCHIYSDVIFSVPASEHLSKKNVVIGMSYSGAGRTVVSSVKNAKQKGASIISITGYQNSELAKLADIPIVFNIRIPNDLAYIHMICMLEVSILAMLQNVILGLHYKDLDPLMQKTKDAIKLALT